MIVIFSISYVNRGKKLDFNKSHKYWVFNKNSESYEKHIIQYVNMKYLKGPSNTFLENALRKKELFCVIRIQMGQERISEQE